MRALLLCRVSLFASLFLYSRKRDLAEVRVDIVDVLFFVFF